MRALAFDLVPDHLRATVADRLVALVEGDGHLGTGFLSTGLLLPTLADAGRLDLPTPCCSRPASRRGWRCSTAARPPSGSGETASPTAGSSAQTGRGGLPPVRCGASARRRPDRGVGDPRLPVRAHRVVVAARRRHAGPAGDRSPGVPAPRSDCLTGESSGPIPGTTGSRARCPSHWRKEAHDEFRVPGRLREGPAVEGAAAGQARALRPAPRSGRARDAVHRPVHRAAVRRRDGRAVRCDHLRVPARQADPDPRAQRYPRDLPHPRGEGAAVLRRRGGHQDHRAAHPR